MRLNPRYCMAAFLVSIGAITWHAAKAAQGQGAPKVAIEAVPDSLAGEGGLRAIGTFEGGNETLRITPKETTTYVIESEGSTEYSRASLTVRVRVKRR